MIGLILIYPHLTSSWHLWSLPLKYYPVFGYSLIFPPSIIERIARKVETDFPDVAIAYTRRVTQIWCIFFIMNGSIALFTALYASPPIWSIYNGLISYILMGLLFSVEYLYRLSFKRRHHVKK
jgi:uncharacterized membrane protein